MIPQSAAACPSRIRRIVRADNYARPQSADAQAVGQVAEEIAHRACDLTDIQSVLRQRKTELFARFLFVFLGFLLLRFRFLFFLFQVTRSRIQRNANRPIPCLHAYLAGHADGFNACPNVQQHQHNHQCQQYNSKQNA